MRPSKEVLQELPECKSYNDYLREKGLVTSEWALRVGLTSEINCFKAQDLTYPFFQVCCEVLIRASHSPSTYSDVHQNTLWKVPSRRPQDKTTFKSSETLWSEISISKIKHRCLRVRDHHQRCSCASDQQERYCFSWSSNYHRSWKRTSDACRNYQSDPKLNNPGSPAVCPVL